MLAMNRIIRLGKVFINLVVQLYVLCAPLLLYFVPPPVYPFTFEAEVVKRAPCRPVPHREAARRVLGVGFGGA